MTKSSRKNAGRANIPISESFFRFLPCLVVNWAGITASVPVNLVYTDTEAPLGLILLLVLGALWIAGIIWALLQQAATLLEIRKAYKDAESSRGLRSTER